MEEQVAGAEKRRTRRAGRKYCNALSLLNKLDELSAIVFDCKPDFIAVFETWGNESLTDTGSNRAHIRDVTCLD